MTSTGSFARLRVLLLATVVLAVGVPTSSSAQSLDQVRGQIRAIEVRLAEQTQILGSVEAQIGALADETAALDSELETLTAELAAADERVTRRVRELYMRGSDDPLLQLLGGLDAREAIERATMARHLLVDDQRAIQTASAARTRAEVVAEQLSLRTAELDDARNTQESAVASIGADLAELQAIESRLEEAERLRLAEERRRRAEEERRRQAELAAQAAAAASPVTPVAPSGGRACPVGQPHSFTDTWGAARSGGRRHKGVDILANYGTPVYAMVSGVWDVRSYGRLAGNWAILRGNDGSSYYYMHLQSHTVGDGARVAAGTQTGTIGDTGNARGTPHLHFEYHPGGGGAVNPYSITRAACG